MKQVLFALCLLTSTQLAAAPITVSKWTLYDLGGEDKCGQVLCPGVLPAGLPSFDLPVGEDSPFTYSEFWRTYLVGVPSTKKLTGMSTLTMTVEVVVTGEPTFGFHSNTNNTCDYVPASIRPYFQSGALWSTSADGSNRWWSNPQTIVFAPGTYTINVPLQPQYWSQTYGQQGDSSSTTVAGFSKTLGSVSWIGATMGGGCFFGHGVNVNNGTAHVVIKSYTVQ